MIKIEPQGKCD